MRASKRTIGIGSAALATAVLGLAAFSVPSFAQDPTPNPEPRPMRPNIEPRPMPPQGQPMPMQMGMQGGVTMIDDAENLYILRGGTLLKVSKSDLSVKARTQLPMGPPPTRAPDAGPALDR